MINIVIATLIEAKDSRRVRQKTSDATLAFIGWGQTVCPNGNEAYLFLLWCCALRFVISE